MADAPVTRAEIEAALATVRRRERVHLEMGGERPHDEPAFVLALLAESVIAALDNPASDEEIDADQVAYFGSTLEGGTVVIDADEDHIMAYDQGRGDERRYLLARIVADEKGGSGG